MQEPKQPIAIYDSGVGGLSIAAAIHEELPHEDLLYIADNLHAPYGNKGADFIYQRAHAIAVFARKHKAKALVIACNTATALAVNRLRANFSMPIIAIEPAIKPACAIDPLGPIAILATEGTLNSDRFLELKNEHALNQEIICQACTGLAESIEKGPSNSEQIEFYLEKYLTPIK
ncbi:MAG: aspartate/glutamate racemase family protein, partial [Planctomycetes bacterium]|nr:aspartate/glutamate racemase family protein [Planctomycetota bacterium]